MTRAALVTILIVGTVVASGAQGRGAGGGGAQARDQQLRDPRVEPKGTAVIAGVITTDETTPQPLKRVRVTVSSADMAVTRTVTTNDNGGFSIEQLPANRYSLSASKPGFVRTSYGAKRPDRPGTPITLAENQKMTGLTVKMPRGSVIAGTIRDEFGQPAFGTNVRLMQYRVVNGERTLTGAAVTGGAMSDTTDDRGQYRLYGLAAGEYVVVATPRNSGTADIRAMSSDEIREATQAMQQQAAIRPGTQQNQQPGSTNPPPPLPPARDYTMVGYAPVYYPGTTLAAGATPITIGIGEERTGIDMPLALVRTAKIEGAVVTPAGVNPQSVQLTMLPIGVPLGGALNLGMLGRNNIGPDGRFSYTGIQPGQYRISARAGGNGETMVFGGGGGETMMFASTLRVDGRGGEAPTRSTSDPVPQLWGQADVNVDGGNISGVVITMQPGMTLTGKIAFDAIKMPAPTDLSRVRVTLQAVQSGGAISVGAPPARVEADGSFTFAGLTPGRYRVAGSAPPTPGALGQWSLKSAMVKGQDALDMPLEIGPNEQITGAVISFTDQTQEVSGMLQDAQGRPAPDFTIIVFAADKRYWTTPSRRIRTNRPGTDGKFTISGIPPGEYRLAALTDIGPADANDPAFLEQLVGASLPITIGAGEKKVQDLRIGGGL
ncbi:MAG TPA: carboxypeptidase-like regulatory domain-containing protein [Vicinamibacterales bacterium]|nr:carboxypeptidase-like regulatory domain-containing protein [Vicinamibacterales bacterium]